MVPGAEFQAPSGLHGNGTGFIRNILKGEGVIQQGQRGTPSRLRQDALDERFEGLDGLVRGWVRLKESHAAAAAPARDAEPFPVNRTEGGILALYGL